MEKKKKQSHECIISQEPLLPYHAAASYPSLAGLNKLAVLKVVEVYHRKEVRNKMRATDLCLHAGEYLQPLFVDRL